MKIGITFGGYCPLHQGHLDVIMRAKKENDLTFVVVCGYDGEPRGEMCDLPLIKRYRIIHNFLEDETLKVIMVNDTELGLDESMQPSNWKIWASAVYKQIFQHLNKTSFVSDTITWYVSESSYKESLEKCGFLPDSVWYEQQVILMDRTLNPISGTTCRLEPLKHWNQIVAPFRAYFSHNILIAGTASEGKTTLCRDIGKYFSLPYSYEKGRDNCTLKTDPELTVKDFIYNIYEQHKYNEELICSPQNPGVFISDTDNMVTLMYAHAYAGRKGFALGAEDYKILEQLADAYENTTTWNKIFLIAPKERGLVDDGERYMEDSDYEIRKNYFNFLMKLYDERSYKFEVLKGDYYENFLRVKEYIEELYK